ncbi:hypothetical protein BD770DRAFT_390382 [Pilaira anomala]|nr:hypothetical protein BD770DRAFT_390382 [Pilaira anomala]
MNIKGLFWFIEVISIKIYSYLSIRTKKRCTYYHYCLQITSLILIYLNMIYQNMLTS